MKIGFSFGRCVRDIVNDKISIDDVLCIIARTHMLTAQHVQGVISEYQLRRGYLLGLDPDRCMEVGLNLFNTGRVLEPRAQGVASMSVPEKHIWMDLVPTVIDVDSQAVMDAWNNYRLLLVLTEQVPELSAHTMTMHKPQHENNLHQPTTTE